MNLLSVIRVFICTLCIYSCHRNKPQWEYHVSDPEFPAAMVKFSTHPSNPVFEGTGIETWDKQLRERGYILYEEGLYKMWYTGYNDDISEAKYLGYATSVDGINWERFSKFPVFSDRWTEDMHVVRYKGSYYMFAEGINDIAHLLISDDGLSWKQEGDIIILDTQGKPISKGPYGTPTVWIENNEKYLFYERNDQGIWLAKSKDFKIWTNVRDEPVIQKGPKPYDAYAVAANQVVKYQGKYYLFYHGCADPNWMDINAESEWNSNVAMSRDLTHWTKYPDNPIVPGDHSSPILVNDGDGYNLYTMHDKVWRYDQK